MAFDGVSLQLYKWIESNFGKMPIHLSAPSPELDTSNSCIGLYLFELKQPPLISTNNIDRSQVLLKYLITAWSSDVTQSHQILGKLFIAASQSSKFNISLEAMPFDFWQTLNLSPQPSFIIEILYTKVQPKKQRPHPEKLVIETQLINSITNTGE